MRIDFPGHLHDDSFFDSSCNRKSNPPTNGPNDADAGDHAAGTSFFGNCSNNRDENDVGNDQMRDEVDVCQNECHLDSQDGQRQRSLHRQSFTDERRTGDRRVLTPRRRDRRADATDSWLIAAEIAQRQNSPSAGSRFGYFEQPRLPGIGAIHCYAAVLMAGSNFRLT